jgi:hypothetical protein
VEQNDGLSFETLLPGEWGSYGGWWVMIFDRTALANAAASETELLAITQPRVATPQSVPTMAQPVATTNNIVNQSGGEVSQPPAATTQPVTTTTTTTYGTYGYGWTADELAAAHPVTAAAVATPAANPAVDKVYPRTYNRAGGTYGVPRR